MVCLSTGFVLGHEKLTVSKNCSIYNLASEKYQVFLEMHHNTKRKIPREIYLVSGDKQEEPY
jgi:hypothetical protein